MIDVIYGLMVAGEVMVWRYLAFAMALDEMPKVR